MRRTRKSVHAERIAPTNATTRPEGEVLISPQQQIGDRHVDFAISLNNAVTTFTKRQKNKPPLRSRSHLSKKIRFEIFKRDGFRCVYCGAVPSDTVLLECDHIKPVAEGGTNEVDNLVTACGACNSGKGATPLSSVPQSLAAKAAEVAEREAQIRAYHEILEAKKARKDGELWSVADVFIKRFGNEEIHHSQLASIRSFLQRLDYFEVLEAMEFAVDKQPIPKLQIFLRCLLAKDKG